MLFLFQGFPGGAPIVLSGPAYIVFTAEAWAVSSVSGETFVTPQCATESWTVPTMSDETFGA